MLSFVPVMSRTVESWNGENYSSPSRGPWWEEGQAQSSVMRTMMTSWSSSQVTLVHLSRTKVALVHLSRLSFVPSQHRSRSQPQSLIGPLEAPTRHHLL